jgi:peroxiredoxin (alkyl hydroperoxide reductase subunit C)
MPSTLGSKVPTIQVPAYVRGRRNARLTGPADAPGSWVVLAFYPRDFDSTCADELADLASLENAFRTENAVLMGVSTGSWLSHRRWFAHHPQLQSVGYPILADTAHELGSAFGAVEQDGTCHRATFLIDPEGRLQHASTAYGSARRSAFATLRTLQALREPDWRALRAA